jgi:hypothetical protein
MELKNLKESYAKLSKKYNLPLFKELNENFEIEKIDRDTEILLRNIRKVMMEKIVSSLNFLEIFLNPMNAPRMYLLFMKSMNGDDRQKLDDIYKKLAELNLLALAVEIDYNERKEAETIKEIFKVWISVKPEFLNLFNAMNKPIKSSEKRERSYFG